MIGLALDGYPLEVCGLLAGVGDRAEVFYPCRNAAQSAKVYEIDGRDYMKADRDAEERGFELMGVMHSHTHTDAFPSPTDLDQAPDPAWHYVIVSLREPEPVLRSFRMVGDGTKQEESVVVERRPAGTLRG